MTDAHINIQVAEGYEELRQFLEKLVIEGLPADADVIYRSRNQVAVYEYNGRRVCIKAFRAPSFPNRYIYTHWRESKARRSYENSLRLRQMGFDAPQPLGYAEVVSRGALRQSYFVNEMLEGYTIRHWEELPEAEYLVRDFAAYMLRMHRAGVMHKDFSPGNFLVTVDDAGQRHFNILDVNRMEFDVHDADRLVRNFRCINLNPAETAHLAREYAAQSGADAAETERKAVAQLEAYERNKTVHRFLKRLIGKQKGWRR